MMKLLFGFLTLVVCVSAWSNPPNCGIRREPPSTDGQLGIHNGEIALAHEFPWMVALNMSGTGFSCGGAILNERWILTAAHCLQRPKSRYRIIAGVHNLANPKEETAIRSAEGIFPHPLYNYSSPLYDYDIGLIKLSESLNLNTTEGTIRPVCLPAPLENLNLHAGDLATAIGWGIQKEASDPSGADEVWSPLLHKVNLTISANEFCAKEIASWAGTFPLTRRMICTNGRGVSSACSGDSGSPVSVYNGGRWQVYGVVSLGYGCSETAHSNVHSRVTEYIGWIEKTITEN